MNDKLLKCPCCGQKAEISTRNNESFYGLSNTYSVRCTGCGLKTYEYYFSPEEAANAWNMREKPPEINIYNKEETYTDCTVQVLTNTVTGETSVGWWKNDAPPVGVQNE